MTAGIIFPPHPFTSRGSMFWVALFVLTATSGLIFSPDGIRKLLAERDSRIGLSSSTGYEEPIQLGITFALLSQFPFSYLVQKFGAKFVACAGQVILAFAILLLCLTPSLASTYIGCCSLGLAHASIVQSHMGLTISVSPDQSYWVLQMFGGAIGLSQVVPLALAAIIQGQGTILAARVFSCVIFICFLLDVQCTPQQFTPCRRLLRSPSGEIASKSDAALYQVPSVAPPLSYGSLMDTSGPFGNPLDTMRGEALLVPRGPQPLSHLSFTEQLNHRHFWILTAIFSFNLFRCVDFGVHIERILFDVAKRRSETLDGSLLLEIVRAWGIITGSLGGFFSPTFGKLSSSFGHTFLHILINALFCLQYILISFLLPLSFQWIPIFFLSVCSSFVFGALTISTISLYGYRNLCRLLGVQTAVSGVAVLLLLRLSSFLGQKDEVTKSHCLLLLSVLFFIVIFYFHKYVPEAKRPHSAFFAHIPAANLLLLNAQAIHAFQRHPA